jgi:hypothetical protein
MYHKITEQWCIVCYLHHREIACFSASTKEDALLGFAKKLAARLYLVENAMQEFQENLPEIEVKTIE